MITLDRYLHRETIQQVMVNADTKAWPHWFRETQGAKVVRQYGDSVSALFAVKRRLNFEQMNTAIRYIERYAVDLIKPYETASNVEPVVI